MGSLLSHPCGKNKGVARMGHPRLVTIPELFPGLKSEILRLRSEQALHAANDGAVRGDPGSGAPGCYFLMTLTKVPSGSSPSSR
jgi:hypothetical protein